MKQREIKVVDSASFYVEMRPNRSLTAVGRWRWLVLLTLTTLVVASAATAIGAWMVLPFAGLEIVFLWGAFRLVGKHDDDYESLRVENREFSWARCVRGRIEIMSGNTAWAKVIGVVQNGRMDLSLRYGGKTVPVGQMIPDEQRQLLCRDLVRVLQ